MNNKEGIVQFNILIIACFLLFAGYFEWCAAIIGIAISVMLLLDIKKDKISYNKSGLIEMIPVILIGIILISIFWSVDKPLSVWGLIKPLSLALWLLLVGRLTKGERECIFDVLVYCGLFQVVIGLASYFLDGIKSLFWMADRFGGVFQYANTNALFLSLCIIILCEKLSLINERKVKILILLELSILLLGMLFTGSRTVLLMFFAFGIIKAIKDIKKYKVYLLIDIVALLVVLLFYLAIGSYQNVSRIVTVFSFKSTFWGRILYNLDGFKLLMKNPFGLGYMGFKYMIPTVQSGVYQVDFVHNDILQIALDYGIVSIVIFMVYLVSQIASLKNCEDRNLAIYLCVCGLFDFHFQYLLIGMILVLILSGEKIENRRKKLQLFCVNKKYFASFGAALLIVCILLCAYLFGSSFAYYLGNDELALRINKSYTPSQVRMLINADDASVAKNLANDILHHNKYIKEAYNALAYVSLMENDEKTASDMKLRAIVLDPYRMVYDDKDVNTFAGYLENKDKAEAFLRRYDSFDESIKARTSEIAYLIKDKPYWIINN